MNWLFRTLWRLSHSIGFVPSILCAVAWVAGGAFVARAGAGACLQHPGLAMFLFLVLAFVVAIGGLISFWVLAHHIDFRMRGYQIWEPTKNGWVYEERRADSSVDSLPFARKIVEDGYPAPCEVFIPSEEGVGATSSSMGPRKARGNFGANRGTLRR